MRIDRRSLLLLGGAGIAGSTILVTRGEARSEAREVPPPDLDIGTAAASEVAVLAGGCFWGVQGVFQHTLGVTSAVSGYAGGEQSAATYETVSRGQSGHAEAVEVTFDPRIVGYGGLLQIFFSVAHDPTQLNRQGPDVGPQYRSAIFPADARQARIARVYIAQLNAARVFPAAIVTRIEADRPFYRAEDYHQDYMSKHPMQPYIVVNDRPKVEDLRRLFPTRYRPTPVLVVAR